MFFFSVFGCVKWFIIIEWLIINLIGLSGLMVWVLLLSWFIVLCIVVKLIMVGMLVKFCRMILVGINVILCFIGFVVF